MENQEIAGQLPLFYTEQELSAKINEALDQQAETLAYTASLDANIVKRNQQANAIEACRGMLNEVDEESLVSIYNTIAKAVGWDTIEAFTKLYTVTVYYKGDEVGLFQDVEADDEDSACNLVLEDMDVEASMNIRVSYGNNREEVDVDIDSWEVSDDFSAEALEQ